MSSVTISGDTSGSIILQAPSVAGSTTLTLPTTSGTVLTNASSITSSQMPAGSIIQVTQTVANAWAYNGTTSTYTEMSTNLRASITPSSSSSKIIYSVSGGRISYNSAPLNCRIEVRRSTNGGSTWTGLHRFVLDLRFDANNYGFLISAQFMDEPATTSSCMYSLFASITSGTAGIESGSSIEERTKIILMEVKG